jgi:hypothetical protein
MKRLDLIRELERGGCVFLRHGGGMTGIRIRAPKVCQPVPRHREIKEHLARHILRNSRKGKDGC